MINVDLSHAKLSEKLEDYQQEVDKIHNWIHEKTHKGNDYLGWVDWPSNYDKEEFDKVKELAKNIREKGDVLLVCGIGGSYLGARAAIEFVNGLYHQDKLEIIYIGNTFSSTALVQVLEKIKNKSVFMNVISKSGSTTETALAFRMIRNYLENLYGVEQAAKRIIVTTDKNKGTLYELVKNQTYNYTKLSIPDDIGGRYSVFTSVGLLPIACAGIDIDELMAGSKKAQEDLNTNNLSKNPAYQYGLARKLIEKKQKDVEIFVAYESHYAMLGEWWKQLFGESEGKDSKGLFPASVIFSTDLHSMGQFIQEGKKIFFETILNVEKPKFDAIVPALKKDDDHLNYLVGKNLHWINQQALIGTLDAHVNDGDVPNIIINISDDTAYTFGYLIYFYFKAVAMSVYLMDVNPFNQPGVEVYKRNMFKLLGKE